jgi:hypothetical protein
MRGPKISAVPVLASGRCISTVRRLGRCVAFPRRPVGHHSLRGEDVEKIVIYVSVRYQPVRIPGNFNLRNPFISF